MIFSNDETLNSPINIDTATKVVRKTLYFLDSIEHPTPHQMFQTSDNIFFLYISQTFFYLFI